MCENGLHTFTKFVQKTEEFSTNEIYDKEDIIKSFEHKTSPAPKSGKSNFKGRDDSQYINLFDDISKLEV